MSANMLLFVTIISLLLPDPSSELAASTVSTECSVEFEIANAGISVSGLIREVKAEINFEERDLRRSKIIATANPSTIETGIRIRDKHLQRSDFFDVRRYPEIRLSSISFRKHGKNKFTGWFQLTIKDVTKVVAIPFEIRHVGDAVVYQASFEVDRLDYHLGESSMIMDDVVRATVVAQVRKTGEEK